MHFPKQYYVLLVVIIITISCNTNSIKGTDVIANTKATSLNMDEINTGIIQFLQTNKNAVVWDGDTFKRGFELQNLYKDNKALWLTTNGITTNAQLLLQQIDSLAIDGFNITELKSKKATDLLQKAQSQTLNKTELANLEIGLSVMAIKVCDAMLNGQINRYKLHGDWFTSKDSTIALAPIIKNAIEKDSVLYFATMLRPMQKEYTVLLKKHAALLALETNGGWPSITTLKDSITTGTNNLAVKQLRIRLYKEFGLPTDTNSTIMGDDVLAALKYFQYMHDVRQTGKLDTTTLRRLNYTVRDKINIVKNNLERLRWLPQNVLPETHIMVNIAKMELQYKVKDSTQFKMRVVVGRPSRETPILIANMSNIVFNPGWSVPPTIMKEEIIPGIAKRGGAYLAKRGLKAYKGGREVNASLINANNFRSFSIQQKPGLNSSLGAVKFNLPNPFAIYLHDTPHREDFVKYYRAYSSGCVRVEKPREFAAFLLNDTTYTKAEIDTLVKKKTTKEVPLKKQINVNIVYLTNGLDSIGNLQYLRDIYNKDAKLAAVWNKK